MAQTGARTQTSNDYLPTLSLSPASRPEHVDVLPQQRLDLDAAEKCAAPSLPLLFLLLACSKSHVFVARYLFLFPFPTNHYRHRCGPSSTCKTIVRGRGRGRGRGPRQAPGPQAAAAACCTCTDAGRYWQCISVIATKFSASAGPCRQPAQSHCRCPCQCRRSA